MYSVGTHRYKIRRYKNMELANKITEAYRKAFEEGTDKAWKSYHRKLKK